MSVEECYNLIGGSYELLWARTRQDEKIKSYLRMWLDEDVCGRTEDALAAGDYGRAFNVIHEFKGVCMTLALDRLLSVLCELNELLRPMKANEGIMDKYDSFKTEYLKERAVIELLFD